MWDWIVAGVGAYIGFKILAPLIVIVIFAFIVFTGVACYSFGDWLRKKRCKHINTFENMACHLICRDCRKDLGFIGSDENKQRLYKHRAQ